MGGGERERERGGGGEREKESTNLNAIMHTWCTHYLSVRNMGIFIVCFDPALIFTFQKWFQVALICCYTFPFPFLTFHFCLYTDSVSLST